MKNLLSLAVVGASSMVGSRFCELYNDKIIKGDVNNNKIIDITNRVSVLNFFQKNDFDNIILFSAYTDVVSAEKQKKNKKGTCWNLNVFAVQNIVQACQKYSKKLIFISTDFVFDGSRGPYSEEDEVGPNFKKTSWYGLSKIEAEKIIQNIMSDYLILRISYPYRARYKMKDDIIKRLLRLVDKDELYSVFTDQIISPTFIDDIPIAVKTLISKGKVGIYHITSPQLVSQYEFTKYLLIKFNKNTNSLKKYLLKNDMKKDGSVPRPILGGLKSDKIIHLGFTPTSWQRGIDEIYSQSNGRLI